MRLVFGLCRHDIQLSNFMTFNSDSKVLLNQIWIITLCFLCHIAPLPGTFFPFLSQSFHPCSLFRICQHISWPLTTAPELRQLSRYTEFFSSAESLAKHLKLHVWQWGCFCFEKRPCFSCPACHGDLTRRWCWCPLCAAAGRGNTKTITVKSYLPLKEIRKKDKKVEYVLTVQRHIFKLPKTGTVRNKRKTGS